MKEKRCDDRYEDSFSASCSYHNNNTPAVIDNYGKNGLYVVTAAPLSPNIDDIMSVTFYRKISGTLELFTLVGHVKHFEYLGNGRIGMGIELIHDGDDYTRYLQLFV